MKIKRLSKILKSTRLFGWLLYEKKLISENTLDFKFEHVICQDIGMYVIGKYPRLEYGFLSSSSRFEWRHHAVETVRLTLLNLINNQVLNVSKVVISESFAFSAMDNRIQDYKLTIVDLQMDKDLFSVAVYNAINEVNRSHDFGLKNYVHKIIDKVLENHETYLNPTRAFIIVLLRKYAKRFKWIQIIKSKKALGMIDKYSVKVEEIYIPRIDMQHKSLVDLDNNLIRNNKDYREFSDQLNKMIEKEFSSRKADFDNSFFN